MQDADVNEVLAALERLQGHGVITSEEAVRVARTLTGDPAFSFPVTHPPAPGRAPS